MIKNIKNLGCGDVSDELVSYIIVSAFVKFMFMYVWMALL